MIIIPPAYSTYQRQICSNKLNKGVKPVKLSNTLPEQINYDEREKKEKSYRIIYFLHFKNLLNKKRRVFRYLSPISIGDFVTEMEWQPLVSAN